MVYFFFIYLYDYKLLNKAFFFIDIYFNGLSVDNV